MDAFSDGSEANIHASCIAVHDTGLLIVGASGSGKSSLSLELMALGAVLVADDRVTLRRTEDAVLAFCPPPLAGMIEARGVGLLQAAHAESAPVRYVLDLDLVEEQRLPEFRHIRLLSHTLPLLARPKIPIFASALIQLLKAGRVSPGGPNA